MSDLCVSSVVVFAAGKADSVRVCVRGCVVSVCVRVRGTLPIFFGGFSSLVVTLATFG